MNDEVRIGIENAFGLAGRVAVEEIGIIRGEWCRPSVLMRPTLSLDGDQWCALYGDDLQCGCAGFGPTVHDAMLDFDKNWTSQAPAPAGNAK